MVDPNEGRTTACGRLDAKNFDLRSFESDRVVVPFDDFPFFQKKDTHSVPGLKGATVEVVHAFIDHHRAFSKSLKHFEALHAIHDAFNSIGYCLAALHWV